MVRPPGSTVRVLPNGGAEPAPGVRETVMVTDCPASRVAPAGDTLRYDSPAGTRTLKTTGPPVAVSVNVPV
jgi:hypothetical protein